MHVIEHIGLGRYGDSLDTHGDVKAAKELMRVLGINADLLIVLPVGKSKISYNTGRYLAKCSCRTFAARAWN